MPPSQHSVFRYGEKVEESYKDEFKNKKCLSRWNTINQLKIPQCLKSPNPNKERGN